MSCAAQYFSAWGKSTQTIGIFPRPSLPCVEGSQTPRRLLSHLPAFTQAS
ncbi:MAG: hypothetical protein QM820_62220 [Minicystis sp.]